MLCRSQLELNNKSTSSPAYSDFLPEIVDKLQSVADTYLESYNEHSAFVYLVAELFETTFADKFQFTDGQKDGGIDFFVKDASSYTICQCKCPDLDIAQSDADAPVFDQEPLNEIRSALDILRDKQGHYDVKKEIRRLRADYQRDVTADPDATNLTAILAVLGELTEPAQKAFISYRNSLSKQGINLKLIEWKNIYQALHVLESPADIDFDIYINYDEAGDLLRHRDYCIVLARAFDFYQAFRQHEWNLFEWNVRYQIHNSPINKRIATALSTAKGRKSFHHYNNGLLMTCKSYHPSSQRKDRQQDLAPRLKLSGPQIINGCQTVRAICDAYESLTPEQQEDFREQAKVQVKIIRTTDPEFIGELVISTNDQNPMNPRNLKSNTIEQRDIQKTFRTLPVKWFYERKDGEYKSLSVSSSRVRWFHKSDYTTGNRRSRIIDNQKLAKIWFAFIGNSQDALRGGVDYFKDEPDGVYNRVFKSIPAPSFWTKFSEPGFTIRDEDFEPGFPFVYQYLLAYSIAAYIDGKNLSFRANREAAIRRGIDLGKLRSDSMTGKVSSPRKQVDEFLTTDPEYFLNIMINNMKEVFIELFSFVLCRKYGSCNTGTSQKLLAMPSEAEYINKGFDINVLPGTHQTGTLLFGPIYEFLKDCVKQYYFEYQAEIKAAPRIKSYLAQRSTIDRLRVLLVNRDNNIREYDTPWKRVGKTFIESLPDL